MDTLELALGFHLDPPPGTPRLDLVAAWEKALAPLLREIEERAAIGVSLHLGGFMLDFLEAERPEGLDRLRALAAGGQLELLGGAYYGAVLSAVPERDALGQLKLCSRRLEQLCGVAPRGVRLAYHTWDPSLPRLLEKAQQRYAVIDVRCFRAAGLLPEQVGGYYATEREGCPVALFPDRAGEDPVSPGLEPSRVLGLLRRYAARGTPFLAWQLDVRELGVRPGSAELCWGRAGGWVPRLLGLLAAQDHWLKLASFASILERFAPAARLYLPACTTPALQDWMLPPGDGAGPRRALNGAVALPDPRLEGAAFPWEALLARYGESNRLHKRCLVASREVGRLAAHVRQAGRGPGAADLARGLERALLWLYQSQSAAALTPDPWGGLHAGRLRQRAWAALLRAEAMVAELMGERARFRIDRTDLDCDGIEELQVTTPFLRAQLDPAEGGTLHALELLGSGSVVTNCLTRRGERVTAELCSGTDLPSLVGAGLATPGAAAAVLPRARPRNPDDEDTEETPVSCSEGGSAAQHPVLAIDRWERACFRDHFLGAQASLGNFERSQYPEVGDFAGSPYGVSRADPVPEQGLVVVQLARDGAIAENGVTRLVRVVKRFEFHRDAARFELQYELGNRSPEPFDTWFAVELNLNLDSDPDGGTFLDLGGERADLSAAASVEGVRALIWGDPRRGVRLEIRLSQPARVWHHPIFAVADGLDGPTAGYQGACLLLCWPLPLWGRERHVLTLSVSVKEGA